MTKEKKDCRLNIRITSSFKTQLEKAAEQDDRTVANFVISVLHDSLKVALPGGSNSNGNG